MPRGRSTSADRIAAGLVSRSTMITFVRSLRIGDIVDIEWRIVPLDDKAPDALACLFLTFPGPASAAFFLNKRNQIELLLPRIATTATMRSTTSVRLPRQ
jgi:hypothetical protein